MINGSLNSNKNLINKLCFFFPSSKFRPYFEILDALEIDNIIKKLIKRKHDPARARDDAARWDVVPTKISMDEVLSTDIIIDDTGDNSADVGERRGGTE